MNKTSFRCFRSSSKASKVDEQKHQSVTWVLRPWQQPWFTHLEPALLEMPMVKGSSRSGHSGLLSCCTDRAHVIFKDSFLLEIVPAFDSLL